MGFLSWMISLLIIAFLIYSGASFHWIVLVILVILLLTYGSKRARLQRIVNRLAPGAGIRVKIQKIEGINGINAFAMLDEHGNKLIIVTPEAVNELDKDELYFVLAHETAHHLKDHLVVKAVTESIKAIVDTAAGILGILGGGIWGGAINYVLSKIFSRIFTNKTIYINQEKEADVEAIRLLKKANLPVCGAYKFFNHRIKEGFWESLIALFIDEHPLASQRWENLVLHYPDLILCTGKSRR